MHACGALTSHHAILTLRTLSADTLRHSADVTAMQIQTQLLGWYDKHHRALPWRRNLHSKTAAADDPEHQALLKIPQQQMIYRVWISEIMCQQTQVGVHMGWTFALSLASKNGRLWRIIHTSISVHGHDCCT